jgi:hypothetical protein
MKVVKAEDVTTSTNNQLEETTTPQVDQAKVEELREKFDLLQTQLNSKEYDLLLNEEQTHHLMNEVYPNLTWKGYESYAISETYEQLESKRRGDGINGTIKTEIVEATFHFLKNHVSTGVNNARLFRQICDQFALPMQAINNDRQQLRDLSLELVSMEQGIPVEQLIEGLKKQNPSFQG